MEEIFRQFEERDIRYLHFKSNTNIEDSFDAKGDFDILADAARNADIEAVITGLGGKRFNPPRLGRYPGVDNWIVYDEVSGDLHHIHLHYQLATGKPLVKDYIIPWSDILFETRIKNSDHAIYVSDPAMELLLLLVRTVVKSSTGQQIRSFFGRYRMNSSMKKEYRDLRTKAECDAFASFAKRCGFAKEDIEVLCELLQHDNIDSKHFRKLSSMVRRYLRPYRRMSGPAAYVLSRYYMLRRRASSALKRRSDKCFMIKKVHDTKGLIVSFVGVDGAGKSTVTKDIYEWLGKKIECKRFYMGRGDGRVPLSMRILNTFRKTESGKGPASNGQKKAASAVSVWKHPVRYMRRLFRMKALLDVAASNNRKIRIMQKYRLNGGISLLDRYPQIELAGSNDGLKIAGWRETFVQKRQIDRLAAKEAKELDIVRLIKPDVIFRLNISAETSMERKPEQQDIETFRKKIDDLCSITFGGSRIIDIDASQPYEQELLEIKRILWSLM